MLNLKDPTLFVENGVGAQIWNGTDGDLWNG